MGPYFFFLLMSSAILLSHHRGFVSGSVAVCGAFDSNNLPPECTDEFLNSPNHTMCICHDDSRITRSGVSDEEKQEIVDLHNKLRSEVDPPATDMPALIWDDKIAAVAQKWANQCVSGHDSNRGVPSYGISIGQNSASGQGDWNGAVMAWYNEVNLFKYGEDPNVYLGPDGWKKVGHYTQVVQNTAFRIGCGYAECQDTTYGRYYICNYAAAQTKISEPYTNGTVQCSACPNSCVDGLCDCEGKMCLNGGSLDYDSCTCTCGQLYEGNTCETLNCPAQDDRSCWTSWQPEHCKYSNVPPICPYMCGICGGPDGATPPPVITSPHGCTYQGIRPSAEECATYGDNGGDTTTCESRGGPWGCDMCTKYSNVPTSYCPVMCGHCDGPCDSLTCNNGGTLNTDSCTCECPENYSGETCEQFNCPDSDSSACWVSYMPEQCDKFSNVPKECPRMCGKCGPEAATPPPVYTSSHGCTYQGARPTPEQCLTYGNNGQDTYACATTGGDWGCAECAKYSNVKTQYCPVMCAYCDPDVAVSGSQSTTQAMSTSNNSPVDTTPSDHTTDQTHDQTTDGSIDQTTDGSIDYTTDGSIDHTTDGSIDYTTDGSIDQTPDGSIDHTTDGSIDHTTDGSIDQTTDVSIDHTTDGSIDHTTDGSIAQTTDQSADLTTTEAEKTTSSPNGGNSGNGGKGKGRKRKNRRRKGRRRGKGKKKGKGNKNRKRKNKNKNKTISGTLANLIEMGQNTMG